MRISRSISPLMPENETLAGASRGPGKRGQHIPNSGVYIPNYRGVNYVLNSAPGSGRVSLMNALGAMSGQYMAQQQALYDNMEFIQAQAQVDQEYNQERDKFLKENPTGRGYTEYITTKYSELTSQALANASNENVKSKLQLSLTARQKDIANSAFKEEKELYTGYAVHETDTQLAATINEIMTQPDQIESLTTKFKSQLDTMQNVLDAHKFEKYRRDKMETLLYSYGLALVKNKPYAAVDLVKGKEFTEGLSPEKFASLQKQAEGEKKHQEYLAKREQALILQARQQAAVRAYQDFELKIELGQGAEHDILADESLDNHQKASLIRKLNNYKTRETNTNNALSRLDEAIKNNEPAHDVSTRIKTKYLNEYFQNNGNGEYTFCEKVKFLQDNQATFPYYSPLKTDLSYTITNEKDATKLMDACLAVAGSENINALKGLDEDLVNFAYTAVAVGAKSPEKALHLQEIWFNPPKTLISQKEQEKINAIKWNELNSEDRAVLSDFYETKVFSDDFRLFRRNKINSPDAVLLDSAMYNTIRDVFMKTGNIEYAKAAALAKFNYMAKKVDGEYMINPPTPENTGIREDKLIIDINKAIMKAKAEAKTAGGQKIRLEAVSLNEPRYRFYYLINEDDPSTREYLTGKDGLPITILFRKGQ